MADIDWTDVTDHVSSLSTISVNAQTDILAYVNAHFDVDVLDGETGPTTKLARVYLASHLATLGKSVGSGAGVGPVTSEKGGRLARSYAALSATGALTDTAYGRLLKQVLRTTKARFGWSL